LQVKQPARNGIRCNNLHQPRRSNRVTSCVEEKDFLVKLHGFMKMKRTPIGRVPNLGFKESEYSVLTQGFCFCRHLCFLRRRSTSSCFLQE
jgi:hypothetical protein